MQFLPATWRAYGMGGDVHDPHDAIMGVGNLLRAGSAPGDYRRALFAYNPSRLYVDAVPRYAGRIASEPPRVLRLLQLAGLRPLPGGRAAAHRAPPVGARPLAPWAWPPHAQGALGLKAWIGDGD